jgi:hypothetical protein
MCGHANPSIRRRRGSRRRCTGSARAASPRADIARHRTTSHDIARHRTTSHEAPDGVDEYLGADSALPHTSKRVLRILVQNNLVAFTFSAHTTNLFQTVNFVLFCFVLFSFLFFSFLVFDSLKYLKAITVSEFGHDSANDHLTKYIQVDEQTARSVTMRKSFRKAGLSPNTSTTTTRPFKILIDEATMKASPGFEAVLKRNVSLENLSRRMQL